MRNFSSRPCCWSCHTTDRSPDITRWFDFPALDLWETPTLSPERKNTQYFSFWEDYEHFKPVSAQETLLPPSEITVTACATKTTENSFFFSPVMSPREGKGLFFPPTAPAPASPSPRNIKIGFKQEKPEQPVLSQGGHSSPWLQLTLYIYIYI